MNVIPIPSADLLVVFVTGAIGAGAIELIRLARVRQLRVRVSLQVTLVVSLIAMLAGGFYAILVEPRTALGAFLSGAAANVLITYLLGQSSAPPTRASSEKESPERL